MKYRHYPFFACLFLFLCCFMGRLKSQTPNPCGVVSGIWPASVDSVVQFNTTINFSSTSTNANSLQWLLDGYISGITATTFNYQITTGIHTISLVAYNGNCSDTTTVVYFAAGTPHNVDSLLMGNYGSFLYNEEGTCIDKTPDGGYVTGGVQYLWNSCGEAGILIKMRDKGCIDWSRKFFSPYYCNNSKITSVHASADTNYYVATNGIELAKLDKNGNILWNNRYPLNNLGPMSIPKVYGDAQGAVYFMSQAYNNGWTITKLDNNGAVTWNKFFRLSYDPGTGPGQTEFAIPSSLVVLNGKIFVCGNAYSIANSTYFSFLVRLDATSGAKDWQYGYTDPNYPGAMGFTHLALYDTLLMASSAAQGEIITLIDQQGAVKKNIKTHFNTNYGPKVTRAGAGTDGHIYLMQWSEQSLPLQPYFQYYTNFAEIDTSMNKYWGMVFSSYSRTYFADATMGANNKFGAVGTNYGLVADGIFASRDIRFLNVDTVNAEQFCFSNGTDYTVAAEPINRINFNFIVDSALQITTAGGTPFTVGDAVVQSRYTCPDYVDSCSFMKITGPVNLCSLSDTYTFRMHRNKKCILPPQWQFPAGVTIVNQTDSNVTVRFSGFGSYIISASLNSCIPVRDSLIVKVTSRSHPLNIGKDTSICNGSTITLHAARDFFSYLWSDGSTSDTLNVTQPGIYWVEVVDSCNNRLRDSVTLSPYNQLINIGPDRAKCNNDTLQLHAPPGFLTYQWSNNYNISAVNTQNVVVNPAVDTAYFLRAEKIPGCFAYDTIRINVKTSPLIQLGADKSLCIGDSAVLDAGPGFSQYQWSNGNTAAQIKVYSTGSYSVTGTATNGCRSYDTLRILNTWPNPVVKLDPNPNLCNGTPRTLQAGNYTSYLWQNGSTASSFLVNSLGAYYVTVTDNHSCYGTDTVHITKMLLAPANFLSPDTAICSYGEVVLISKQLYNAYLWGNGEASPSVTVTRPGLYWLQVTDNNSCKGVDSVKVVQKDCMKGLYIPTAFSPNHDSRNDIFKALLFGNVIKFNWVIYDRYGEVIFVSNDLNKGWDGTIRGVLQNTGTFTWVCRYRFAGEAEQIKAGSVVLVH